MPLSLADMPRELREAVAARPEDDAPRLVYADYLEERGEPFGELIQVQCALARGERGARARERELLAAHRGRWLAELGVADCEGTFRRGMLDELTLSPPQLGDALAALRRGPALIRSLRLRLRPEERMLSRELHLDEQVLAAVEVLDVDLRLDDLAIGRLCAYPLLCRVSALVLRGVRTVDALVSELAAADLAVRHLDLSFNALATAEPLWRAPWLAGVERLVLTHASLGDAGALALGGVALPRLGHLDLGANGVVEPSALAGLLAQPALASLELPVNRLRCEAIAPSLPANLAHLNLSFNEIGAPGAAGLAAWRALEPVASLLLWGNPCGEGEAALVGRFGSRVHLGDPWAG
jgi:uncharacterized protein (TIGR02996 family)